MRHVIVPVLLAAGFLAACNPTPATPGASASPSAGSSAKPSTAPSSAASAAPNSASAGEMSAKVAGTDWGLKGNTIVRLTQQNGKLEFYRASRTGPSDPENPQPTNTVTLIFEKTKGLKPFVLPTIDEEQARRVEFSRNGIIGYSSIVTAKNVEDTFKYDGTRIKGTWTMKVPFGGPTAALEDCELTVDVEVPDNLR